MKRTIIQTARKSVTILPIPMNLGQPNLGLDKAPGELLSVGLGDQLGDIGWSVRYAKPVNFPDSKSFATALDSDKITIRNCEECGHASQIIHSRVKKDFEKDTDFPLILGGDHGISIGTISALQQRKRSGIVWVDAHADINTPLDSSSGNVHGMPLAFLLGLYPEVTKLPGFEWFKPPYLDSKDIVYIGLRDVDAPEKRTINQLGIKAFSMYDVDRIGIGQVMEQTLDHLDGRDIHLSFDIDAIDPFYAPHTGTAVRGGLTYREGNYICEHLAASKRLTSMELVEVDPDLHSNVDPIKTIDVARHLILSAMGNSIL